MSKKRKRATGKKRTPKTDKATGISGKNNKWLLLVVALALSIIALYPSLNNEFTNWDDDRYVTDNPYIAELTPESVAYFFNPAHPISSVYNPLTMLTLGIEKHFFGLNPKVYHVNNLILHLACTALVFWLMRLLGLSLIGAFVATLLFGIHPMRVESVAWVTERKDVLFGFFYIAALISYMYAQSKEGGKWKYLVIAMFMMFLSGLSKIQAVSLPLSMLAIDFYLKRSFKSPALWLEKAPFFAISLLFGSIGLTALDNSGSLNLTEGYAFYERLLFGAYALCNYVFKLFLPVKLSAYYPYPAKNGAMLPIFYYLAPLALAVITWLVYRSIKHTRAIAFGSGFFLVNVIFLLQIVGAGEAYLADRFTYIGYIGLFFALAWAFERLLKKHPQKYMTISFFLWFWLLFLATLTFMRCKVWKNSETLWTDVINKYPDRVPVAHNNRGTFYRENNQPQKALADYNKAIEILPRYHLAYNNRGNVYFREKDNERAMKDYAKAIEILPDNDRALNNRGAVYFQQKKYDLAEKDFNRALELNPRYADAYLNRAIIYSVTNRHGQAKADYDEYIKYKPDYANAYIWRGIAYRHLKQYDAALRDINRGLKIDPKSGNAYFQRAITYAEMGNKSQARQDAQRAQQLGYKVDAAFLESLK